MLQSRNSAGRALRAILLVMAASEAACFVFSGVGSIRTHTLANGRFLYTLFCSVNKAKFISFHGPDRRSLMTGQDEIAWFCPQPVHGGSRCHRLEFPRARR